MLAALLAASLAVTGALVWFGLRSLRQERDLARQRKRERLETAADAVAAAVRGKLAEVGDRLSSWISNPDSPLPAQPGGVIVTSAYGRTSVVPRGALPFVPGDRTAVHVSDRALAEAEAAEFSGDLARAGAGYHALTLHRDPRIRAEALLRLGRVLRKRKDLSAAARTYEELAGMANTMAGGLPAELAGLDGQRLTLTDAGDVMGQQRIATQITRSIDGGRWLLARGPAEFYREELSHEPKPDCWLLAEALSEFWQAETKAASLASQRIAVVGAKPMMLMWRSNGVRSAALAGFAAPLLLRDPPAGFACQLAGASGERTGGSTTPPPEAAARVIGDPQNPWMMHVWAAGPAFAAEEQLGSRFLLAMLTAVVLFLWGTVYFMARAIRREARVAQLQSDFVAAVSHEFRSPLTTVRQLAEMLEMGQVPNEERRRRYYQVLAAEARRLQRLVETMLNFGKMEAGVEQYRFEKLDVGELVDRAVREALGEAADAAGRVRIFRGSERVHITADADALTLALRNLIDNGLKYSPKREEVEVRWEIAGGRVLISVADRGPGIPQDEQEAVFQKFMRGRSAIEASVQGTGVGLAMVRHILTAHGGAVHLASAPGHGSTFTIELAEAK